MKLTALALRNVSRHRRHLVLATSGIVFGLTALIFFVALGTGLQRNILDRLFPSNSVVFVPRSVSLGPVELGGGSRSLIRESTIESIRQLEGVRAVHPRADVSFPALVRGGDSILGQTLYAELVADGIPPELVSGGEGRIEGADDNPLWAFRDWEHQITCALDTDCAPDMRCDAGTCLGASCTPDDEFWTVQSGADADSVIRALRRRNRSRYRRASSRSLDDGSVRVFAPDVSRMSAFSDLGQLDLPGEPVEDVVNCPNEAQWCDPTSRRCRMMVPTLVSPVMLELYNGNVQSMRSGLEGATALPRLNFDAIRGIEFESVLGRGFLGNARGNAEERTLRFRVIGMSNAAMPIGATVPLGYVQRWNAAYNPADGQASFNSLVVEIGATGDIAEVVDAVTAAHGLELHPRSRQRQRISSVLRIATLLLALLGVAIIALSALNLTNTFLLTVSERKREFGVLRALGAKRSDVVRLVLSETLVVAATGFLFAWALALAALYAVELLLDRFVTNVPFVPDQLHSIPAALVPCTALIALGFCLLGALWPAWRAARVDPMTAMDSH